MYHIEIGNKRDIEIEENMPKYAYQMFMEIVHRNPDKEVSLWKDNEMIISRGRLPQWQGFSIGDKPSCQ